MDAPRSDLIACGGTCRDLNTLHQRSVRTLFNLQDRAHECARACVRACVSVHTMRHASVLNPKVRLCRAPWSRDRTY